MAKKKTTKKKSVSKLEGDLKDLAKVLSGETTLRKKAKELDKLKKAAVEKQQVVRRKAVVDGDLVMDKDDVTDKKVVQKMTIFEWEVPVRYSFDFNSKTFLSVVGLSMVFILYLAVLGHYGLMGTIIALLFFIYAAGTTAPLNVTHKITTRGIDTMDFLYEWFMLDQFWFTKKNDQYFLLVTTGLRAPAKLIMLVEEKNINSIFVLLQDKLLYMDMRKQGKLDKMTYGEYIALEEV